MSRHGKRDILIHFDEDKNEIILYTVAVDDTEKIRAKEFDGAKLDIAYILDMSADEAEKMFGGTIFSLLDAFSFKKTGVRPYEALNEERHRREIVKYEIAASAGDPEAQYILFIEYHSRAVLNKDAKTLALAEQMLEAAANQKHGEALKSKESWPALRAAIERGLKGD